MKIEIGADELAPIIEAAAQKAVAEFAALQSRLPTQCLSEAEAASWLGVAQHTLRDERLRGGIVASRIMGRRICYLPETLFQYVMDRREIRRDGR